MISPRGLRARWRGEYADRSRSARYGRSCTRRSPGARDAVCAKADRPRSVPRFGGSAEGRRSLKSAGRPRRCVRFSRADEGTQTTPMGAERTFSATASADLGMRTRGGARHGPSSPASAFT